MNFCSGPFGISKHSAVLLLEAGGRDFVLKRATQKTVRILPTLFDKCSTKIDRELLVWLHVVCRTLQMSHDHSWRGLCVSTERDSYGRWL